MDKRIIFFDSCKTYATMEEEYSDIEEQFQETDQGEEEEQTGIRTPPKPKQKRKVSAEAKAVMLANLEKARAAKRANVTKYPVKKRPRAIEMYEADVAKAAEEKARLLAEELLQKKEKEREFQELKKWKESHESQSQQQEPKPKRKAAVKKTASSVAPAKSASTKSTMKKGKSQKKEELSETESESVEQGSPPARYGWNSIDFNRIDLSQYID
ncbi:MAG: hypothetical protein JWM47_4586 [Acidimicrobiales bacterium]|nr:hypothetical protein [Acidimicrobiales bacterium]